MIKHIKLDYDTADRIALLVLKNYRSILKKGIKRYKNGKQEMHSDDVATNLRRIEALNLIIRDFGE